MNIVTPRTKYPDVTYSKENAERLLFTNREIEGIYKEISGGMVRTIQEEIFKYVFLPLFADGENLNYPHATMQMWIDRVAGNAYLPVNVVDQRGTVLFQVPSMIDRANITPHSPDCPANSFKHIAETFAQYAMSSPMHGEAYIKAKLANFTIFKENVAATRKRVLIWNEIFKRYGRLDKVDDQVTTATVTPVAVKPKEDLYDII